MVETSKSTSISQQSERMINIDKLEIEWNRVESLFWNQIVTLDLNKSQQSKHS